MSDTEHKTMSEMGQRAYNTLIAADKVNGTNVYNPSGEKLGSIDDIMIDKATGHTIYAIMSFGGFLGMGEKHFPLPWGQLKYDTSKDGYVTNLDKKTLESAPNFDPDANFEWTRDYGKKVDTYYKAPDYWS